MVTQAVAALGKELAPPLLDDMRDHLGLCRDVRLGDRRDACGDVELVEDRARARGRP